MVKNSDASVIRHQVAALPLRIKEGRFETCLITTRSTKRWTIPKGWPMKGLRDCEAARIEAEEEAGLSGSPKKKPIGTYQYWKRLHEHFELVETAVYVVKVTGTLPAWKERGERSVQWMSLDDAAVIVDEPGLAYLLKQFPDQRKRKARASRKKSGKN